MTEIIDTPDCEDCNDTGRLEDGYCDCPEAEGAQEADCDGQSQMNDERPDSCYDSDYGSPGDYWRNEDGEYGSG